MSPTVQVRLIEDEQRRVGEVLDEARRLFERTIGPRDNVEWRSAVEEPVSYVAAQARAADLVIVGRHGPGDALDHRLGVLPGPLLMGLGRPVLLVPPRVERLSAARVVVAWKDTREARRAVLDGLPLLRAAEAVFVVTINKDECFGDTRESAADLAAYLTRHRGASTTVLKPHLEGSVAQTLQRTAEREGADLIVSGAYGHSRLCEWAFGGVTRELLEGTSVCCLLSR